jgi:hypothetical protein
MRESLLNKWSVSNKHLEKNPFVAERDEHIILNGLLIRGKGDG